MISQQVFKVMSIELVSETSDSWPLSLICLQVGLVGQVVKERQLPFSLMRMLHISKCVFTNDIQQY
jgi:hypothetical protein